MENRLHWRDQLQETEVFMNKAFALAVKVVVVAVGEALLFLSVVASHVEGCELSINDIFFCCSLETEL